MNWRKKTKQEFDQANDKKDYTGGYEFLPWVWYLRKPLIFAFFLNIFFGYKALDYGKETVTLIAAIFFGIAVPAIIGGMLFREWKHKKKGINH
jgi:hypothetical protein